MSLHKLKWNFVMWELGVCRRVRVVEFQRLQVEQFGGFSRKRSYSCLQIWTFYFIILEYFNIRELTIKQMGSYSFGWDSFSFFSAESLKLSILWWFWSKLS